MQTCENERDVYISTILEDMFQYFDQELCAINRKYRSLQMLWRLKSALIVFRHLGLAEYQEDVQPSPMMVPSRELMRVLKTSRITTSLKPLVLPPIVVTEQEAKKYFEYSHDLSRCLNKVADYFKIMRPALFGCELGWVEHVRDQDGTLRWSITSSGIDNVENGTLDLLEQSDKPFDRN